jgi:lipid A 3-O-deacylase
MLSPCGMLRRLVLLGLLLSAGRSAIFAQAMATAAVAPVTAAYDPLQHWEFDFESGVLWHITGTATRLDYVIQPQIFTVKTPLVGDIRPLAGGDLVMRSRFSLLVEPIVEGPEHHYLGFSASGILEWWDRPRTRALFFSGGGGFGELDSKGYEIVGAQGEHFNFNWFLYTGARLRQWRNITASAGIYFQHISNGRLNKVNPGVNALGPMLSLAWHF